MRTEAVELIKKSSDAIQQICVNIIPIISWYKPLISLLRVLDIFWFMNKIILLSWSFSMNQFNS